jgi:hypothetical protein
MKKARSEARVKIFPIEFSDPEINDECLTFCRIDYLTCRENCSSASQRLKSDFYLCFLAGNQLLGMSKKQLDPPPSQPALDWLLLNFLAFKGIWVNLLIR